MKKALLLLVAGMLIISCLAGCSKKESNTVTPSGTESQPAVTQKQDNTGSSLANVYNLARNITGASYEMKTTMTSPQGGSLITNSKIWMSATKYRVEMDTMGVKTVVIGDSKGDVYMYNPATNSAMKLNTAQASKDQPQGLWAGLDMSKYTLLGEETISGQKCIIVRNSEIPADNRTWISTEIGMPIKSEFKSGDATVAAEFTNIKLGAQSDDLFVLPAGAKVQEMAPKP